MRNVIILAESLLILMVIPSFASANPLPPDLADNTAQEITGYAGQLLISSQSAAAYDPERDAIYMWGGHPPGGGFPQPDELFIWNVANGSWTVPRPANLTPSAYCIGAGPSNNIYDEALHGYIKIGNLLNMKGQWFRNPKMAGVVQIYTPADNDWHYMNPIGFPEPQPYTGINSGGARVYDRNSGTLLYGTPSTVGLGGAIYDTWSNTVSLMGGWNWLLPHVNTAGQVVFDLNMNKYYLYDGETGRSMKWYTPGASSWTDKTPSSVPAEYSWNGSDWAQNTAYPPQARGATAGTTMDSAGAWDDLNKRAVYFIPVAVPRPGIAYEEWHPNYADNDADQSVRPTAAGGGWQGYRYTSLVKFLFTSGSAASAPSPGQIIIQGGSRGTVLNTTVSSGSFAGGDATGVIYFKPLSWNVGPFSPGPVDLYQSDGITLVRSSVASLVSFQSGGRTGSIEPSWPTGNVIGQLIQDGTMTWVAEAYIGQPRIEIWAYDPAGNSWERKGQIDGLLSHRAGDFVVTYVRNHNLFFIVDLNSAGGTGIGNKYYYYRYAKGEIADYPKNMTISVNANAISLSWEPIPGATGYNVYKGSGNPAASWSVSYSKVSGPAAGTSFTDSSVSSHSTYFYHVTALVNGKESMYSPLVRSDPKSIQDGYVQVNSVNSETVNWKPAENAISYNIYRAPVTYSIYNQGADYGEKDFSPAAPMREMISSIDNIGNFVKVNAAPIAGTYYTDSADLSGGSPGTYKVYAYRVTGTNSLGVESGPSAYWLTIPDEPRHVQWTENWTGSAGDVRLEWQAPPQTGVMYRVYYSSNDVAANMHESTAAAISATSYKVQNLPKLLSAIYVTAIDSLGQEGITSPRASIYRPSLGLWESLYLAPWHSLSGQQPGVMISYFALPSGTTGSAYSQALLASGGTQPYSWQLASGSLPPGLSLSQSGTISGTPSTTGQNLFSVTVMDSSSPQGQDTTAFSITIASTQVDTNPPMISGIGSSGVTAGSATISWQTDEPATSQVEYGTTAAYGSMTNKDPSLLTAHSVRLSGLFQASSYHYRVISIDQAGNPGASGDNTFTTTNQSSGTLQVSILTPASADLSTLYNGVSYRPESGWSSHKITYVPSKYLGNLTLIRLSFNDQSLSSANYLSFTLSRKAAVYVAYDWDATPPNWLTGSFASAGDQLSVNQGFGNMTIWSKTFDGGTVTLGGNGAAGANGYNNMYSVFIRECQKADSDCDGCISMSELNAFISRWKVNNQDVTLKQLMDVIVPWKRGCG